MSLKISRILHAGYVFECERTQIAFDPIFENPFSQNCYAFPDVRFDHDQIKNLKLDAVFISHYHDDHCSLESLQFIDRRTPIYIYCLFEEMLSLIRELGFENVQALEINTPVFIGSFEITPWPALDSDVDSIFQIKAAGMNVLNVVDSWIDLVTLNRLAKIPTWDLLLWPFQSLREIEVISPSRALPSNRQLPREHLEQLKILNPRFVVPSSCQFIHESWSWYNQALFPISYEQFQEQVQSILPESRIVRLNPSVAIVLDQNSVEFALPLSWVLPVGEQDVDYCYQPDLQASSTAEISKRFDALTSTQAERVYQYCRSDLLERYRSMEASAEPFFLQARIWQLSVYDHTGEPKHFFYRIQGKNIDSMEESQELLSWTTELPLARFYGALDSGESLTSMYVRINDRVFESQIEKDIQEVDLTEDPLLRCLFNGAFGVYQIAQLKRLQDR